MGGLGPTKRSCTASAWRLLVLLAATKVSYGFSAEVGFAHTASRITIVQETPSSGAQDFAFTTTGGLTPASFTLDDDAVRHRLVPIAAAIWLEFRANS